MSFKALPIDVVIVFLWMLRPICSRLTTSCLRWFAPSHPFPSAPHYLGALFLNGFFGLHLSDLRFTQTPTPFFQFRHVDSVTPTDHAFGNVLWRLLSTGKWMHCNSLQRNKLERSHTAHSDQSIAIGETVAVVLVEQTDTSESGSRMTLPLK